MTGGDLPAVASIEFARAARELAASARAHGWSVPSFRSPPGVPGALRTLRRRPDGGSVVAVALRGRPRAAILADMIEGIVVASRLDGAEAQACRDVLWSALATPLGEAA